MTRFDPLVVFVACHLASLLTSVAWAQQPIPTPSVAPSATPTTPSGIPEIAFDHFEESTLFFKSQNGAATPKPYKTELYDLKYLGALRNSNDLPYFLVSGRPCKDCLQDLGIYAIRPIRGAKPTAYVFPGKILEHKNRALVLESRAFFGHCLARQPGQAYVVYQKERIDRKNGLQSSVFIAEPGADHMNERLIERRPPKLQDTLRQVKLKACQEIEGRNRIMLSKPLDIKARHTAEVDSDGDDDTKENQTDGDLSGP